MLKELRRDCADFAQWSFCKRACRPFEGLFVHVAETCKGATREKICLHRVKAPLIAGLSVMVAYFMADKFKAVLLSKTFHFRHHDGVAAGSSQAGKIGVVNDTHRSTVLKEGKCLVEKALHGKASEKTIKLQKTDLAVAQIHDAAHYP